MGPLAHIPRLVTAEADIHEPCLGGWEIVKSDERQADTRLINPHSACSSASLSLNLLLLVVSTAGPLHDSP